MHDASHRSTLHTHHNQAHPPSIGFVGTYPPTQCGIATFTAATAAALTSMTVRGNYGVVQLVDGPEVSRRPEVVGWLRSDHASSRRQAAAVLASFDVTVVQHEYGIYGGEAGADVLALLDELLTPCVVVLHTVLRTPSRHQRAVLESLAARADRLVVMSEIARTRLVDVHGVDPARVRVIPHGATPNLGPPTSGRTVLTWGLIGPGKGIEWGIDALTLLDDLDPPPRYVVAGQTHPKVAELHGESYRDRLRDRAARQGVAGKVAFTDQYNGVPALLGLARNADVVLLPYDSDEQVTSGVLVEALASGKPVVATEFPHAVELLSRGAGLVVPHRDPEAIAAALRGLLTDPALRVRMTAAARRLAPAFSWSTVAEQYVALAAEVGSPPTRSATPARL